jgi:hypothetical protein
MQRVGDHAAREFCLIPRFKHADDAAERVPLRQRRAKTDLALALLTVVNERGNLASTF